MEGLAAFNAPGPSQSAPYKHRVGGLQGIHLIRHAIYTVAAAGGQFVLLGSGHSDGIFRWVKFSGPQSSGSTLPGRPQGMQGLGCGQTHLQYIECDTVDHMQACCWRPRHDLASFIASPSNQSFLSITQLGCSSAACLGHESGPYL